MLSSMNLLIFDHLIYKNGNSKGSDLSGDFRGISTPSWYSLEREVAQSCLTLCDPMDCSLPARLLQPWDFPGKNSGVGCRFMLQGSVLIPESCPPLLRVLQRQGGSLPAVPPDPQMHDQCSLCPRPVSTVMPWVSKRCLQGSVRP